MHHVMLFPVLNSLCGGIANFFVADRVLGVDIGTVSIKLVALARGKKGAIILENYGILETHEYLNRPNAVIQTSALPMDPAIVGSLIATLVREVQPKTRRVVATLPLSAVFVAPIELPAIQAKELKSAVEYQARQYIPVPIEQVDIDWVSIGQFENAQGQTMQRVLLTAIPKELTARYRAAFAAAELTVTAFEVETHALARALLLHTETPTLIIDVGGFSTNCLIVERGVVQYAIEADFGGFSLTQSLARSLQIAPWRAEELKRRRGLIGTGGEQDLSTSLAPFLDVILRECNHARQTYEKTYGKSVTRAMIVGGGGNLPGVSAYANVALEISLDTPRPLARVTYPPTIEYAARLVNTECAAALGAALHRFMQ